MQPSIFIKDFSLAIQQKEHLTRESSAPGQWRLVDYTTTDNSGVMLYAGNNILPPTVTIAPGLSGWHRIYVSIFSGETFKSGLSLRLSGDTAPAYFTQGDVHHDGDIWFWSSYERCEECFWKAADLTGKTIDVSKIHGAKANKAGLMWLRFEPMTEKEVNELLADRARTDTRTLHAHTDNDWMELLPPNATLDEYASVIDEWAASDVEIASVETACLISDYSKAEKALHDGRKELVDPRVATALDFKRRLPEILGEYARRAEKAGMKLYSAQRMELANMAFPMNDNQIDNLPFVTQNPQWQCRDRNGDPLPFLSYAYPEVGDYMIGIFLKAIEMGCHGATPVFIRGMEVMFEEPVKRRFKERYPEIDPGMLPLKDARLAGVRCSFLTDFLRRMRKAFDEYSTARGIGRLGINPVVCYGFEDNKVYGFDVETWAREGIIDSLVVGNMKLWEEDEHYRDAANPDLISVEAFTEYKWHGPRTPISRIYGSEISYKLPYIREYMDLAHETGVKVYFEMPWEGQYEPQQLRDYAIELYKNGAENISLWDCYTLRVTHRPEWQISSRLGHRDELPSMPADYAGYRNLVRITSFNGVSIASYNPSWRG